MVRPPPKKKPGKWFEDELDTLVCRLGKTIVG